MNTAVQVPANSKTTLPAEFKSMAAFQKSTVDNLIKLDWQVVAKANSTWHQLWDEDIKAKL